jgi:hypothetical protein
VRLFFQKLTQDVRGMAAMRDLVSVTISGLLLGRGSAAQVRRATCGKTLLAYRRLRQEFAFARLPNLTYNIFAGTSLGVCRHVFQWWWSGRFQGFDYGARRNVVVHGAPRPPNYLLHYDAVDVPVRTGGRL